METLKLVIFYLLLIDAVVVNLIAWLGQEWYVSRFRTLSRYLPMSRAWTALYLTLVLWIGFLTLW